MENYVEIWKKSSVDELGQLAQDIRDIKCTNMINFMVKNMVQIVHTVTYGIIVVDLRP